MLNGRTRTRRSFWPMFHSFLHAYRSSVDVCLLAMPGPGLTFSVSITTISIRRILARMPLLRRSYERSILSTFRPRASCSPKATDTQSEHRSPTANVNVSKNGFYSPLENRTTNLSKSQTQFPVTAAPYSKSRDMNSMALARYVSSVMVLLLLVT